MLGVNTPYYIVPPIIGPNGIYGWSYPIPTYYSLSEKDKIYVNYIGPSVLFQQRLGAKRQFGFTEELSIGYAHYREENRLVPYQYLITDQGGVGLPNGLQTGNTFGGSVQLGFEYYPLSWLSVGVNAGGFYAKFNKLKVLVPVTYLTEGNPAIQTAKDLTIRNDSAYFVSLSVGNKGDGILLWKIIEKPEWITIYFKFGPALPDSVVYPLPQNIGFDFKLYYDINTIPFNDQNGKIVIVSNDINNSTTVINIPSNIGTPSLYCSWDQFDFGTTDTSLALFIYNLGDGFLNWKIDSSLPKWLTVSKTNDVLTPYNSQQIMLTCNRSLLPAGQQKQTIYLKTNDKNNPSYPITVTATGQ